MPSASAPAIRLQIEATLAARIPSALTPAPRILRPVASTGIPSVDDVLAGGLPLGAITELVGPECSGRTSFALSFLRGLTQAGRVCAWIDVSNSLNPESAAAAGVDLSQLLWVRCGVRAVGKTQPTSGKEFALPERYFVPPPIKKGLHGGGFGSHPRHEVKGISEAVGGFLTQETIAPRCAEPQHRSERRTGRGREFFPAAPPQPALPPARRATPSKPWTPMEQALKVTDLLLQAGGFSALVLDMSSIAPEYAARIPLATWFRYRAAAERSQASLLLLTQHACAKSSAGLLLHLQPGAALCDGATVFTGLTYRLAVARERFKPASSNVIPLRRPSQRTDEIGWQSHTPWSGGRRSGTETETGHR